MYLSYDKDSWLSIDAGMDAMGCCKVVSITHGHRGTPGNILVDFLLGANSAKRIRISHESINSVVTDPKDIERLESRLSTSRLVFNVEDKERNNLSDMQGSCSKAESWY